MVEGPITSNKIVAEAISAATIISNEITSSKVVEPTPPVHIAANPGGHFYFAPIIRARWKTGKRGGGIAVEFNVDKQLVKVYWGVYYKVHCDWVPVEKIELYLQ